jgi:hypothetical protein
MADSGTLLGSGIPKFLSANFRENCRVRGALTDKKRRLVSAVFRRFDTARLDCLYENYSSTLCLIMLRRFTRQQTSLFMPNDY